jgi:imidazolonepropionase-like amidohydrolase
MNDRMLRPSRILLALSLLAAGSLSAQAGPDSTTRIALVGVTVIDGTGQKPRPNQTILIQGETIVAISPAAVPIPVGVRSINLPGRFVIPGLIDAHVHVATDPSSEDTRARTEIRLRKALMGGVTAVRDMAGDVRSLASLQRDALLGEIASPDIYYVALFAGPAFFADPRTHDASRGLVAGQVPWMRGISDTTDLRQAVAEAHGTGATAIKLYAALSGELAARITSEAHAQGLRVWAHAALRPATPIEVVNAGVDVVSHASLVARAMDSTRRAAAMRAAPGDAIDLDDPGLDSLFVSMKRRGTALEPTLLVFAENPALLRLAGAITKRAHRAGVTIIAGTDTLAGVDADSLALPNIHKEIELLVRLGGLSPAEALLSATRNSAVILDAGETRGTIEAGKLADLVVLGANPLTDIQNTRTIQYVVKRGKVYQR